MEKGLIICVDDEKMVLDALKSILREPFNDFILEFAESAEEALEVIEDYEEDSIDPLVVVTDWMMPGMKGDEFLVELHMKYPQALKIILSGLIDESGITRAREEADLYECLTKPWDSDKLVKTIRDGLKKDDLNGL